MKEVRLAGVVFSNEAYDTLSNLDIEVSQIAKILNEQTTNVHRYACVSDRTAENGSSSFEDEAPSNQHFSVCAIDGIISDSRTCRERFKAVATIPIAGYHQHEKETGRAEVLVGQNPIALRSSRAIQLPLLVPPRGSQLAALETKGVVFTKRWVVELLLDLAGYRPEANLVDSVAVEPATGDGAFLGPMIERLADSSRRLKRPLSDCKSALIAYELDDASAERPRSLGFALE